LPSWKGAGEHGCNDGEGQPRAYPIDLVPRKVYVALPDEDAERHGLIRVIDESGEDYLYPKARFRSADALSPATKKAVLAAEPAISG
jgi:hypothetical protein